MWQLKKKICLDQNQTVDALSCPYNSHFSFFLAKIIPILDGPPRSQFWGMNYDWSVQITFPSLATGLGINIKSVLINESKENPLCTLEKYFLHWKETHKRNPFDMYPSYFLWNICPRKTLGRALLPISNHEGMAQRITNNCLRTTNFGTTCHQTFHHGK